MRLQKMLRFIICLATQKTSCSQWTKESLSASRGVTGTIYNTVEVGWHEDTGLIPALKAIHYIKDVIYMLAKAFKEMPETKLFHTLARVIPDAIKKYKRQC